MSAAQDRECFRLEDKVRSLEARMMFSANEYTFHEFMEMLRVARNDLRKVYERRSEVSA